MENVVNEVEMGVETSNEVENVVDVKNDSDELYDFEDTASIEYDPEISEKFGNMSVVKNNDSIKSKSDNAYLTQRKDMFWVDPLFLTVEEGHNAREFNNKRVDEHIESLVKSIVKRGVITPIKCRRENIGKSSNGDIIYKYIIVDGECRFRALTLIKERGLNAENTATVPVILENIYNNELDRAIDMIVSNEALRFLPVELAYAYRRLMQIGLTEEQIAQRLDKPLPYVKGKLHLLGYSQTVINAIQDNKITENTVRRVAKKVKDEGITDNYANKRAVSERLEKAIARAEEDGETEKGKKLNIAKYLDFKQSTEERLADSLEMVINALPPKKDVYKRQELLDLLEDLQSGIKIENAINHIFSSSLIEEEKETANQ
jgi:ParB/RepB/Spo0J family partition protein